MSIHTTMAIHPLAGPPALSLVLIDVSKLIAAYSSEKPDVIVREQRVAFGTSGHRDSVFKRNFNAWHILAITQAICEYRAGQDTLGPLYLGRDTDALSEPASTNALEVLAANGVEVMIDQVEGYTPARVSSHAILTYKRERTSGLADGIVITPSHNPPEDGGIKYNPPHGGAADTDVTKWIENRANALLAFDLQGVTGVSYDQARRASTTHQHDYLGAYVGDLAQIMKMDVLRSAGLKLGIDPLGGSGVAYWRSIAASYDRYRRNHRWWKSMKQGEIRSSGCPLSIQEAR